MVGCARAETKKPTEANQGGLVCELTEASHPPNGCQRPMRMRSRCCIKAHAFAYSQELFNKSPFLKKLPVWRFCLSSPNTTFLDKGLHRNGPHFV